MFDLVSNDFEIYDYYSPSHPHTLPPSRLTALSPVTSPTHTALPSPKVPARRKISAPHYLAGPPADITDSNEYKEDVTILMRRGQSSRTISGTELPRKPALPPRIH